VLIGCDFDLGKAQVGSEHGLTVEQQLGPWIAGDAAHGFGL
jgi:hypothetical protein